MLAGSGAATPWRSDFTWNLWSPGSRFRKTAGDEHVVKVAPSRLQEKEVAAGSYHSSTQRCSLRRDGFLGVRPRFGTRVIAAFNSGGTILKVVVTSGAGAYVASPGCEATTVQSP